MDAIFFTSRIKLLLHFVEDDGIGWIIVDRFHFLRILLHVEKLVFFGLGDPEDLVICSSDSVVGRYVMSALAGVTVVDGITPSFRLFTGRFKNRNK